MIVVGGTVRLRSSRKKLVFFFNLNRRFDHVNGEWAHARGEAYLSEFAILSWVQRNRGLKKGEERSGIRREIVEEGHASLQNFFGVPGKGFVLWMLRFGKGLRFWLAQISSIVALSSLSL